MLKVQDSFRVSLTHSWTNFCANEFVEKLCNSIESGTKVNKAYVVFTYSVSLVFLVMILPTEMAAYVETPFGRDRISSDDSLGIRAKNCSAGVFVSLRSYPIVFFR